MTREARDVTLQARSQTSIQTVAPGPLCKLFSFHIPVHQMHHMWYHAKACCVMWLRGDARQVRVDVWSDTLARDGKCHFDAHFLKATCCLGRGQDRQGILDGELRKHLMSRSV